MRALDSSGVRNPQRYDVAEHRRTGEPMPHGARVRKAEGTAQPENQPQRLIASTSANAFWFSGDSLQGWAVLRERQTKVQLNRINALPCLRLRAGAPSPGPCSEGPAGEN